MLNSRAAKLVFVLLFSAFCIVETLSFTYFKKLPIFAEANSVIYLVCGVCIATAAMYFAFVARPHDEPADRKVWLLPQAVIALGLLIFLAVLYYDYGMRTYPAWPLSYKDADMLPLIQKACERFITEQDVYANPINEPGLWPNAYIPYLPAMWFPFVPATFLGIDIRWTLLVVSIIGYTCFLWIVVRLPISRAVIAMPVFFLLFFILTKYFTWEDKQYFLSLSQEAVPAFFYLLLFIALMRNKDWAIAIMLALCTLSRYAIVLFVPVYVIWLLADKNYKSLWRFTLIYTGLILCLFVIPFFIKRPDYFMNITAGYEKFEKGFWYGRIEGAKAAGNLGLAYFIGYNVEVLSMLKPVMLILTALFSAVWLYVYYRFKESISANKELWLLAGFKLALVLFYNFISMPFQYLFIVPTIVSYPLLLALINKTNFKALNQ